MPPGKRSTGTRNFDNAWLTAPADLNILFKTPIADRWREAAKLIGVDILTMPGVAGHA